MLFRSPKDAWNLLIQVYGKEIKKFIDARRLLETELQSNKTPDSSPNQSSSSTPASTESRPENKNNPPILPRKQYEQHLKANLLQQEDPILPTDDTSSTDRNTCHVRTEELSEEDCRVLNTLRSCYSNRHICMARTENSASLIVAPTHQF